MKPYALLLLILVASCKTEKETPKAPETPKKKPAVQKKVVPPPRKAPESATPTKTRVHDLFQQVWLGLDKTENGCPGDFDYYPNGGVHNLSCHAKTLVKYEELIKAAGKIFLSGPHSKYGLNLNNEKDFGHYNPKFVTWLAESAVPRVTDKSFIERTQRTYDKAFKTLATAYLRAHHQLESNPWYLEQERAYLVAYLKKGSGGRPLDRHEEPSDMYNIYAPAMSFWIRRDVDGTRSAFFNALVELVRAYDPKTLGRVAHMEPTIEPPKDRMANDPVAEGSITHMIREVWTRFGRTSIGCDGKQFEYQPGGSRVNYCYVEPILSFTTFKKKVGLKIFLSGPHSDTLNLSAEREFGRYNPDFVRWATANLIPAADDRGLKKATQAGYDRRMRVAARAFYAALLKLKEDRAFFSAEKKKYEAFLKKGGDNPHWGYWDMMPGDYSAQAIGGTGVAFWLRRSIDGTDTLFEEALEKLLGTYDSAFLEEAKKLGFNGLKGRKDLFSAPRK